MKLIETTSQVIRLNQVLAVLIKHGLFQIASFLQVKNSYLYKWLTNKPKDYTDLGRRAREVLEELGPTYIKLGQVLSTRYDLFPAEVITQLEKLQDSVQPLPFSTIRRQIERSTQRRLRDMFTWIDRNPLATASIAQVHRAELRTGEQVVVKVRKPNIERKIRNDLDMMMTSAELLEKNFLTKAVLRPVNVIQEFRIAVLEEINFTNELRNIADFGKNFENEKEDIVIPKVYEAFCTRDLLVMEFLEGVRITDIQCNQTEKTQIARRSFRAVLKMIFEDGFYHADPHPSNVLVLKKNRVAFLDLGLVGKMSQTMKQRFFKLVTAAYQKDYVAVTDIFYSMGEEIGLKPDAVSRKAMLQDLKEYLYKYADLTAKNLSVFQALKEFLQRSRKYNVFIPAEYTLLFKTLFTIEGVGTKLDPNFDLNGNILEFSEQLFMKYPELLAV